MRAPAFLDVFSSFSRRRFSTHRPDKKFIACRKFGYFSRHANRFKGDGEGDGKLRVVRPKGAAWADETILLEFLTQVIMYNLS